MKHLVLLTMLLFLAQTAHALSGPISSGGGNAVLCRAPGGEIASAELFDLFEGRALYGYMTVPSPADYKTQARAFAKMLGDSTHQSWFVDEMERLISSMRLLPADTALIPVDDSGSVIRPVNCELFQAAVYQPSGKVYFDSTVWNAMNETNKAALMAHEVLYAYLRYVESATNSTRTRQYVAFAFAGNTLEPKWKNPYDGRRIETCSSRYTDLNPSDTPPIYFTTRLNTDGTWTISFDMIYGKPTLGRTELTGKMSAGFSWPATDHQNPYKHGGAGASFVPYIPPLITPLDENISMFSISFGIDNNASLIAFNIDRRSYSVYFSCQTMNP